MASHPLSTKWWVLRGYACVRLKSVGVLSQSFSTKTLSLRCIIMFRWLRSGYTKNFLSGIKKLHRCSSLFYMAPPAGLELGESIAFAND